MQDSNQIQWLCEDGAEECEAVDAEGRDLWTAARESYEDYTVVADDD